MQGDQQEKVQKAVPATAPHAAKEPMRRRINAFLSRWIQQLRFVLLGILAVAIAFFLVYIVYSEVSKKRSADSTTVAEAAQTAFDAWQAEADATKKAVMEKDLRAQLDTVVTRFPRQYGGQRGLFLRGQVGYATKAWDAARTDFQALAERFPGSYLAPVSLFNAGACAEETGDLAGSAALYAKVAADYADSPVAPRALFNQGRVAEARSAWSEAQAAYEKLDTTYSQSEWQKLAKNRLIALKVEGKVK